jgi:hypothetical protein
MSLDWKFIRISDAANEYLGIAGRMSYASKSMGSAETIFNANVFNYKAEKVWFGDLDLERWSFRTGLLRLSEEEGPLYVLSELDGRFQKEMPTPGYVKAVAAVTVQNGVITHS